MTIDSIEKKISEKSEAKNNSTKREETEQNKTKLRNSKIKIEKKEKKFDSRAERRMNWNLKKDERARLERLKREGRKEGKKEDLVLIKEQEPVASLVVQRKNEGEGVGFEKLGGAEKFGEREGINQKIELLGDLKEIRKIKAKEDFVLAEENVEKSEKFGKNRVEKKIFKSEEGQKNLKKKDDQNRIIRLHQNPKNSKSLDPNFRTKKLTSNSIKKTKFSLATPNPIFKKANHPQPSHFRAPSKPRSLNTPGLPKYAQFSRNTSQFSNFRHTNNLILQKIMTAVSQSIDCQNVIPFISQNGFLSLKVQIFAADDPYKLTYQLPENFFPWNVRFSISDGSKSRSVGQRLLEKRNLMDEMILKQIAYDQTITEISNRILHKRQKLGGLAKAYYEIGEREKALLRVIEERDQVVRVLGKRDYAEKKVLHDGMVYMFYGDQMGENQAVGGLKKVKSGVVGGNSDLARNGNSEANGDLGENNNNNNDKNEEDLNRDLGIKMKINKESGLGQNLKKLEDQKKVNEERFKKCENKSSEFDNQKSDNQKLEICSVLINPEKKNGFADKIKGEKNQKIEKNDFKISNQIKI